METNFPEAASEVIYYGSVLTIVVFAPIGCFAQGVLLPWLLKRCETGLENTESGTGDDVEGDFNDTAHDSPRNEPSELSRRSIAIAHRYGTEASVASFSSDAAIRATAAEAAVQQQSQQ